MEQLSLRQQESRISDNYTRLSAAIRMRLKQYNNEVRQLKMKLQDATNLLSMYPFIPHE